MADWSPFREFVRAFTRLLDGNPPQDACLSDGEELLRDLLTHSGWLPRAYRRSDPNRCQHYLLWCDPFERFSVVSFVLGPGLETPIHDHTLWGLIGVYEGLEFARTYRYIGTEEEFLKPLADSILQPGDVAMVSPEDIDVHIIRNVHIDPSISIHVYGGNIGKVDRHLFELSTRTIKKFRSGYANRTLPYIF
ncbi:cysteine dioxygenase [Rhodoligotrophos defluvii]|uniref:cysteine dioxygenase family protein n=1 Tax=Rhodoligotrophos defluvii TaxID=2561934 RepID=UPI0010CA1CB4|nr:cysteine dioxygenase [Rhodoligotrophos defluvii]